MVNFINLLMIAAGVGGLLLTFQTYKEILAQPAGNERMQEISDSISRGAHTFLRREGVYVLGFVGIVFLFLAVFLHVDTAVAFVTGALCSLAAGYFGMRSATIANVRTTYAASQNDAGAALMTAFKGGSVMGLAVASLGIFGLGVLLVFLMSTEGGTISLEAAKSLKESIAGFGMGASSVALFARVGGGIFTKAADVGADLVGKVEAGIPEDDPRNPGVIADNVGDNVGDVAGMGADIFESYVGAMIACMAIGATMAVDPGSRHYVMLLPFIMGVVGLISSIVGIKMIYQFKDGDAAAALRNATMIATAAFIVAMFLVCQVVPAIGISHWAAIVVGAFGGIGVGFLAEYYTSYSPVKDIAEASRTGSATNIIQGVSVGFMSCFGPLVLLAMIIAVANWLGGTYAVALAAVAMLSTVGITMSVDAYGPISDNAGGISEMAGCGPETRKITDKLDSIGNTTAAIGKGFAIGSAALTALALFGAYAETIADELNRMKAAAVAAGAAEIPAALDLSILNANVVVGVLIGAALPCLISAMTITSVGKAASRMVDEIRRQFREIPGLLEGKEGAKPDVERCIDISTTAALSEMKLPGISAVLAPVIVGFVLGADALAGMLLGATVVGVVLALFMANSGGAWDNAKKYIEQGMLEGQYKGGEAHKAAVVGDTVGDPFKDTAGPSLNILIKLMSIVALLIAPLIV